MFESMLKGNNVCEMDTKWATRLLEKDIIDGKTCINQPHGIVETLKAGDYRHLMVCSPHFSVTGKHFVIFKIFRIFCLELFASLTKAISFINVLIMGY